MNMTTASRFFQNTIIAVFVCFASLECLHAAPVVHESGFRIEQFCTTIPGLRIITFGENGSFGNDLYAIGSNALFRVDENGTATSVAVISPTGGSGIDGMAYGSGNNGWSTNLFLSQNEFEITEITSAGVQSQFSNLTDTAGPLERGQGLFGDNLYYGGRSGGIGFLDNSGVPQPFVAGLTGPSVESIVFAPDAANTGIFMYALGGVDHLYKIDHTGGRSVFHTGIGHSGMAYDNAGLFGNSLFVGSPSDQSIYRINLDGTSSLFASGFGYSDPSETLAFGTDGALYYADAGNNTIWRIVVPVPTAVWGGIALLVGIAVARTLRCRAA